MEEMKKILLLAGIFSLAASGAIAADYSPYVSAKLRFAFMKNDAKVTFEDAVYKYQAKWDVDDEVFGGSIAAGLNIPLVKNSLRAELEYNHNGDAKKTYYGSQTKVETQALLLNAYYQFDVEAKLKPYISAGIGGAKIKGSVESESVSKNSFAWQIGLGTSYEINQNVAVDGGYRYVSYGQLDKTSNTDLGYPEKDTVESKAHELYLGLRYNF